MKPVYLIIKDFFCHDKSEINFTEFNSALIVGKIDGNDSYSNGVGKTTIFKAIEYVLFNASDVNLEKIIRDETNSCKIIFDFESEGKEYRVTRSRTKKGTSDLSLYQRTANDGDFQDVHSEIADEKFWKDISGRRAPDTEKDLVSLIKINPKAFRSTVHFAQNDFSGLTTATPEKRKFLLKEALSLSIYSKLEKIAKEQSSSLIKEIDKQSVLLQSLGSPEEDIVECSSKISLLNQSIEDLKVKLQGIDLESNSSSDSLESAKSKLQDLNNQNKYLISQKTKTTEECKKTESIIADLTKKKNTLLDSAKRLSAELKLIKESKDKLDNEDYTQVAIIQEEIQSLEEQKKNAQINFKSLQNKISELQIPMPEGSSCKHCRQTLTNEHILLCKEEIGKEIADLSQQVIQIKETIGRIDKELLIKSKEVKDLQSKEKELQTLKDSFISKEKELKDKKQIYNDYNSMLTANSNSLAELSKGLEEIEEKIKDSSIEEMNKLSSEIGSLSSIHKSILSKKDKISKEINDLEKEVAVASHIALQKEKDKSSKKEISTFIKKLNEEHSMYPKVIDSFSSHGIPNLIIQNLLDDLQGEANKLLESLKPGLQLQFVVEKENKNDTLDILYFVQGKSREYEQLSGAMKLAVNFSLKLGLSFLLQNMFDTQINFLLLDEIDQALDKAGVDAFADIVKHFQKDFTILVITHNDHLKNKFNRAILVEQNRNMISTAKVVETW